MENSNELSRADTLNYKLEIIMAKVTIILFMKKVIKTREFLTASELMKVKDVSLDENEALRIFRDAFVEQCEKGLTFAQLKSNHLNDEFGNISAAQYRIAISKLLSLAGIKRETSVKFGCATPAHSYDCVTRLVITEEMGYNTHIECKKFYARHAKMLQNRAKNCSDERTRKYLQIFDVINGAKPTRMGEHNEQDADKKYCKLPGGREYLTCEEFSKVFNLDVNEYPNLKEYQTVFICQCLAGIRTVDAIPANEISIYLMAVAKLLSRVGVVKNAKKTLRIHPDLGRCTFVELTCDGAMPGMV